MLDKLKERMVDYGSRALTYVMGNEKVQSILASERAERVMEKGVDVLGKMMAVGPSLKHGAIERLGLVTREELDGTKRELNRKIELLEKAKEEADKV